MVLVVDLGLPALDSQEHNSKFLFPVHFLFCFSMLCCSVFHLPSQPIHLHFPIIPFKQPESRI